MEALRPTVMAAVFDQTVSRIAPETEMQRRVKQQEADELEEAVFDMICGVNVVVTGAAAQCDVCLPGCSMKMQLQAHQHHKQDAEGQEMQLVGDASMHKVKVFQSGWSDWTGVNDPKCDDPNFIDCSEAHLKQ